MIVISLLVSLCIGSGILAHWRSLPAHNKTPAADSQLLQENAVQATPTPQLAKEYVYAGQKLLAMEEKRGTLPSGNGVEPEPTPEPTPPPPLYTDIAVFRPSEGAWYVLNTVDGSLTAQMWGMAGDKPVPGDYDGDGKVDFAVFRPSDHTWYILRSSNGQMSNPVWGMSTDEPVPGDYDGDGKTDVAVRRGDTWYILKSSDPENYITQQWGADTDLAVPGDYDGDGTADIATFNPNTGTWSILRSVSPPDESSTITMQWGESEDQPLVGDFDGDAITDFTTFRPSDTLWRMRLSFDSSDLTQQWGLGTDKPVPGDYDGDGKTDIAVVRPRVSETDNHSTWYILKSSDGGWMVAQWGMDGDIAVPGKYNRVEQAACTNCS